MKNNFRISVSPHPTLSPTGNAVKHFRSHIQAQSASGWVRATSPKTHSLSLRACMAMIRAIENASQRVFFPDGESGRMGRRS